MSHTLSLYRLQQIDFQIDRLQARLAFIQKTLDDDIELRKLDEQVRATESRCQSEEQELKQAEENVGTQHIKIEQTQSSLYGAKSHSPKELLDLQKDLAALKRYLVILEDHQIEAMMKCESAEADLQSARARYLTAKEARAEESSAFRNEQVALDADIERFSTERSAAAGAIPTTELSLYDKLRQEHRGIAVALIGDQSCEACGSTLSLAQIQSARSSVQMAFCPSCGRILYGS